MTITQFRSLPLKEAPAQVDRENKIIYGVSAAQAVEALGHSMILDAKTLEQIVALGNSSKKGVGIKSRYTHPGLSSDGMGKLLGRMKHFRIEGDKAVGDMHLYESAFKSPDGNLGEYVMDLAEEDSSAFGMSIVAGGYIVWPLADGTEVPADDFWEEDEATYRPANAATKKPVFRVEELNAIDVVDEPATNRDGMFSAHLWGTNKLAEEVFGHIDALLQRTGLPAEKVLDIALKYGDARGVKPRGVKMEDRANEVVDARDDEIIVAVEIENEGESEVTHDEMATLQAELAELRNEREENKRLAAKVEAMEAAARLGRFVNLAKEWQGEPACHVIVLEALGEGTEAYSAYVSHMTALSEQISTGGLFAEVGRIPKTATGSAAEQLHAEASKIRLAENVTTAKAMELAAIRNPDLYAEHIAEMRGN